MNWSNYQQAVFSRVKNSTENIIINAVAGSGKTTVLKEVARILGYEKCLYAAFNTKVRDGLAASLPQLPALTINQVGHRTILSQLNRRANIAAFKEKTIAKQIANQFSFDNWKQGFQFQRDLMKFAATAMNYGLKPEFTVDEFNTLFADLDIENGFGERMVVSVKRFLSETVEWAKTSGNISFLDQIYIPVVLGLQPSKTPVLLLDECQDLSETKMRLMMAAVEGGRLVACGDPFQAIYGFAGAGADSFSAVKRLGNCEEMPLSLNYRCPKNVVEFVNELVPQIKPYRDDIGDLDFVDVGTMMKKIKPGSAILSRRTSPLVELYFRLISNGIQVEILGREIGDKIISDIEIIEALPGYHISQFVNIVNDWYQEKIGKLSEKKEADLIDRVNAMIACYEGLVRRSHTGLTQQAFKDAVKKLFLSEPSGRAIMSTIHRVKGAEYDDVFIIDSTKLPLTWQGQTSRELNEEYNLAYVAFTRARKNLYIVTELPAPGGAKPAKPIRYSQEATEPKKPEPLEAVPASPSVFDRISKIKNMAGGEKRKTR